MFLLLNSITMNPMDQPIGKRNGYKRKDWIKDSSDRPKSIGGALPSKVFKSAEEVVSTSLKLNSCSATGASKLKNTLWEKAS